MAKPNIDFRTLILTSQIWYQILAQILVNNNLQIAGKPLNGKKSRKIQSEQLKNKNPRSYIREFLSNQRMILHKGRRSAVSPSNKKNNRCKNGVIKSYQRRTPNQCSSRARSRGIWGGKRNKTHVRKSRKKSKEESKSGSRLLLTSISEKIHTEQFNRCLCSFSQSLNLKCLELVPNCCDCAQKVRYWVEEIFSEQPLMDQMVSVKPNEQLLFEQIPSEQLELPPWTHEASGSHIQTRCIQLRKLFLTLQLYEMAVMCMISGYEVKPRWLQLKSSSIVVYFDKKPIDEQSSSEQPSEQSYFEHLEQELTMVEETQNGVATLNPNVASSPGTKKGNTRVNPEIDIEVHLTKLDGEWRYFSIAGKTFCFGFDKMNASMNNIRSMNLLYECHHDICVFSCHICCLHKFTNVFASRIDLYKCQHEFMNLKKPLNELYKISFL